MTSTLDSTRKLKRSTAAADAGNSSDGALFSLLHASSLACVVIDESQDIKSWNNAAEALLGWKAGEVLDQPLSRLLSPDNAENRLQITARRAVAAHADLSFRKKSGESLIVEVWSSALASFASMKAGYVLLLRDITEKKFLEEALLDAAEREQRRIGQELHDHLCQHLLGAAFAVKGLAGALDHDHSKHAPQLHALARLINDAVSQARDISRGLHPVELDAAGLMSALQELANRTGQSADCSFRCDRRVLVKDSNTALNAYRIAQAAVTAALQQTGAKKIEMVLSQSGDFIRLQIIDDGKNEGELTRDPSGVETKTLQYRAEAMHGSLSLNFDPDKGTDLNCLFPP